MDKKGITIEGGIPLVFNTVMYISNTSELAHRQNKTTTAKGEVPNALGEHV